jgi:hypothetical protein
MADAPSFDLRTQRECLRHGDSAQLRMQQARKSLAKTSARCANGEPL